MIIKENRTDAYIGTVDLSDSHDMALVKNVRKKLMLNPVEGLRYNRRKPFRRRLWRERH